MVQEIGRLDPPVYGIKPIWGPNGKVLIISRPFGKGFYKENLKKIYRDYLSPVDRKPIKFRPAKTPESIFAFSQELEELNECLENGEHLLSCASFEILSLVHLGLVVIDSEGVFVNPPTYSNRRTIITNSKELYERLNQTEKTNGIYLGKNYFGFAPYDSFEIGLQDRETFVRGGLARVLEHTPSSRAEELDKIASCGLYKKEIIVGGFKKQPILPLNTISMGHSSCKDNSLIVGLRWKRPFKGYAFGVLDD